MSSGVDNHETSEDDYNKSTQETNSQSQPQPGMYDNNQMTSEESHTTSTQEHKSHSATSHTVPCQTNMQNEQGLGNSGLDSSGLGSRAQPAFGGNAAAGGSSYSSGARQPSGIQNDDPLNKLDPRANRSNEQANVGNQRGVY
jgi:hypothetical protein